MALEYHLMPDEKQSENGPGEQGGIFGKLPSARPGVRSPRRAAGKAAEEAKGATEPAPVKARAKASPRPPTPRRPPPPPASPEPAPPPPPPGSDESEPPAGRGGGVEDVAWAGITVAAEAATLGVRLLSRAVEAVRKPTERR
jgi:hypothetical protein